MPVAALAFTVDAPALLRRRQPAGARVQFERMGYFCVDRDTQPDRPVFNRTVGLRDTWEKVRKKG